MQCHEQALVLPASRDFSSAAPVSAVRSPLSTRVFQGV